MKYLVFAPEVLLSALALAVIVGGRFGWFPRTVRPYLPHAAAVVVVVALGLERWAGGTTATYLGAAVLQDRFALFTKAVVLVALALVIAATDWSSEDSGHLALAMPMLAAVAVMVAASAADLLGLWIGLELAGAAGVVLVALRRPDLGMRLLVAGGVASALVLVGLVFVYASTGNADLAAIRGAISDRTAALPLAIPALLLVGGLAVRAGLAPFHLANLGAGLGASPLGAALLMGMAALAAGVVAVKLLAALLPVPDIYATYAQVVGAGAMVGGGAAALAVRSPRPRMAYLATSQLGWVAAGLATHFRSGMGASLFLLGAFAVAATCGPALLGRAEGGEPAIAGLGG